MKKWFPGVNPGFGVIVQRHVKSYFRLAAAAGGAAAVITTVR